jgi:Uma2 family endonuclease
VAPREWISGCHGTGFVTSAAPCYRAIMRRGTALSDRSKLMSLKEWADLDEDVEGELVDGVLEEEEMPSFLHEILVAWFIQTLRSWVRRRRGHVAASELKIAVGPRRGRKPDVSVFLPSALPEPSAPLVHTPPHLVVEVTSPRPRDTQRDRVDKLADYARAGIGLYLLVDPQLRSLEVYELGRDGRYAVAAAAGSGRVRVPRCPGLVLNLDTLWDEVDEAERSHARRPRRRT